MLVRLRPLGGGNTADALYQFAQAYCFHSPLSDDETREIQLMKVRVERERIPGGIDPRMHIKLGPGGLSDIQWLVELLQLQSGSDGLRSTDILYTTSFAGTTPQRKTHSKRVPTCGLDLGIWPRTEARPGYSGRPVCLEE